MGKRLTVSVDNFKEVPAVRKSVLNGNGTTRMWNHAKPTRNGPCSCGSGVKFKKCCGPKITFHFV